MNDLQSKAAEAEAAKKTNWDRLDIGIEHHGRAITLPEDPAKMPLDKAIEALMRKQQDEMQPYNVFEVIHAGHPHDAAVAFVKAMANLYGWASPVSTPGFFGPRPPQMISVKCGPKSEDVIQCPLGAFKLPGVDQHINTIIDSYEGRLQFIVHGQVLKKDRHLFLELANEARRIVKAESIYQGKAIRLTVDEYGNLDMNRAPEFLDVSDTSESSLIFDDAIRAQINTSILTPIKATDLCRKHKIPLKRGILLEGPYGTGKSLTARMVGNVCTENGWTFVLLDKVQGLRAALEFANYFAPAVVFAEDIDRIAEERDEDCNDLINTIDGVVSKNSELMTILTTNHVEKLSQVILRPGRLDAVISLRAPTQDAVEKLIRYYAGTLLSADVSVTEAAKELSGQIPASIRECVERAKLGMIARKDTKLNDGDLTVAAQTMKNHLALLNKDKNTGFSAADMLAKGLQDVVLNGRGDKLDKTHEWAQRIDRRVSDIHDNVC